jgi:hypothetical protein
VIFYNYEDPRRYTAPPDERDDEQDPWEGAMDESHEWAEQQMTDNETQHHND